MIENFSSQPEAQKAPEDVLWDEWKSIRDQDDTDQWKNQVRNIMKKAKMLESDGDHASKSSAKELILSLEQGAGPIFLENKE